MREFQRLPTNKGKMKSSASWIFLGVSLVLFVTLPFGYGRPVEREDEESDEYYDLHQPHYKDTEEILTEMNNDDDYEQEKSEEALQSPGEVTQAPINTVPREPVYFPRTDIQLNSIFEQVHNARLKEVPEPVELPVPYFVWKKDPTGRENQSNYWKRFYNSMYKVD